VEKPEFSVAGRRVVVVGAARSGVAAAELLVRKGAHVTLTERADAFADDERLRALGVSIETGGHRLETFRDAELVVTSPGVSTEQPAFDAARRGGAEIIGEVELAWRWLRGPVIAVTGTKGKSTTTTLIGRMLRAAGREVLVGGNIGVPLSAHVEHSRAETVHVVEVSSFQLETTTSFRPWIAIWLNLASDHLDRHPSLEAYAAAKARIFSNQTVDDWLVTNEDDAEVTRQRSQAHSRSVTFSLKESPCADFVVTGGWITRRTQTATERVLPLTAVELAGRHMLNNVLAAVAASDIATVTSDAMAEALTGFRGLEHVMEPVGEVRGVRFVNDSKATNIEAAARSIESFESGVVALIGGRFKGGDFRDLRGPLAMHGRAVVAIGESSRLVRDALEGVVPVMTAESMRDAVEKAYAAAAPEGVVLLAPACASFDWFSDYAERGRAFKEAVNRLRTKVMS